MTDYTKITNFTAKDTALITDTQKILRGAEFDAEFNAIATAISSKFDNTKSVSIISGTIDGTTIGSTSPSSATFSSLTATTADINAGTLDNVTIGGTTAGAGTFTNLTASGTVSLPSTNVTIGSVDSTEIGYLNGVTSNIQTQFNNLNTSNWDTAYGDKVNNASFNTSTGVLTLTRQDLGTVTTDLDGRYATASYVTFTPTVTDESGNTGSIGSAYGYAAKLVDENSNTVAIYFLIKAENINTSGLVSTDDIQLGSLPSGYRPNVAVSMEVPCGSVFNISLRSTGANVSGWAGVTNDKLRFRSWDGVGATNIKVSDVTSGFGTIVISGVIK